MYMAPEQAQGLPLDHRADLFSLGSVLYTMVSGRPPFRAAGTVAVLKRVADDTPRAIKEIIPETPRWLCDIIAKLHAKRPDDRYQTAREVADVLADCEAQLKANSKLKDFSRIPRSQPQRSGRGKWAAAAAALLLPLLALAGIWAVPSARNYLRHRGELEILPGEGLVSVIVLHNDEGVLDDSRLHAPATDWLAMKQRQTLTLTPGRYQVNVGTWPPGSAVDQWEVTASGLFGSNRVLVPVVQTSAIVSVDRGQCVTLRPVMRPAQPMTPFPPVPIAKPEPLPPTFKNGIGMEFVIVPKGKSWLGGGKNRPGDKEVEIPADFYLGKYEVTQEEWTQVMGENPSHFARTGGGSEALGKVPDAELKRFPVECVSWEDCQQFVAKLNEREKEAGWVYRLPTEAEWEYACRGGPMADRQNSAFDFYFAGPTNTLLPEQANIGADKGLNRTCKVGSYQPNALGLCDLFGNVWEWCGDPFNPNDPALGSGKVYRGGGSWGNDPAFCQTSVRASGSPTTRDGHLGLRLARVPSGVSSPSAK
jgi:formylglycine-generating enzyme required for sulfatase activity